MNIEDIVYFCNIMEIRKIEKNKKKYLDLLLLADEQESMIDRYLERGDMFVMFSINLEPISSAVVTNAGENVCELKSLAVSPQYQRKGYGKQMVDFLCKRYADKFKYMIVGTGEVTDTISFYKNCGFKYSHIVPDYFTDNYDHQIVEKGIILKDMVYFRKDLFVSHVVYKKDRDALLISSMVSLWEKSVKASHDFLSELDINNLIPVVKDAIKEIENLIILYHGDSLIGFIGMEQRKIEMLFVSPEYFGCGCGKELVNIAITDYGCIFVDVNEQNPKARDFYSRMGFRQYERTNIDEQGNPFPIIKMKLYV